MAILFSLPVHERNDIVRLTIANAQQHNPGCTIAIHVSAGFTDFDWSIRDLPGVVISPFQHGTRHGFNQLGIHLSNHAMAAACGIRYDHFCVLHTSEMFIRSGLEHHIGDRPYATWHDRTTQPRTTDWHPMRFALRIGLFDGTVPDRSWYIGHILEGMWIRRDIMERIHAWCSRMPALFSTEVDWTAEEIVLPTLANWFGEERGCKEPYNAFHDGALATIEYVDAAIAQRPVAVWPMNQWNTTGQLIMSDGRHIHSVKRLARDLDDPVRQHLIRLTGLDQHAIMR